MNMKKCGYQDSNCQDLGCFGSLMCRYGEDGRKEAEKSHSCNDIYKCRRNETSDLCNGLINSVHHLHLEFPTMMEYLLEIYQSFQCRHQKVDYVNYGKIKEYYKGDLESMFGDIGMEIEEYAETFAQDVAEKIDLITYILSNFDNIYAPFPKKGGEL